MALTALLIGNFPMKGISLVSHTRTARLRWEPGRSFCAFRSHLPWSADPVQSSGYRAVIVFKIYGVRGDDNNDVWTELQGAISLTCDVDLHLVGSCWTRCTSESLPNTRFRDRPILSRDAVMRALPVRATVTYVAKDTDSSEHSCTDPHCCLSSAHGSLSRRLGIPRWR